MTSKTGRWRLWLPCLLLLGAACGKQGSGGSDGGPEPLALDERLGAGEVRAGVITKSSELLQGPEAQGGIGDFKIYNDRVAFVIEGLENPRGWAPFGGTLLDADRIRPAGESGLEVFQEMFPNIDLFTLMPTVAAVIDDGQAGGPARIRIEGRHHGVPLLDAILGGALTPKNLEIAQEYILEPDRDYLRIRTELRSGDVSAVGVAVGDLVLHGDLAQLFIDGKGPIDRSDITGTLPYIAGVHPGSCTLYTGAKGPVSATLSIEGLTPLTAENGTAPAAGAAEPYAVERLLIVGAGSLDSCLRILRDCRGGAAIGTVQGTVAGNVPEAGVTVIAHDTTRAAGDDIVDASVTDLSGAFELQLPAGTYTISAQAPGRLAVSSPAFAVVAGETVVWDLTVQAPATLFYTCQEVDGAGVAVGYLPCKLTFQAGAGANPGAAILADLLTFGAGGLGALVVPPGAYTLTFSHGWEYGIDRRDLLFTEGATLSVDALLPHQLDTTGYLSADLHNHSGRSPETHFPIEDKLASNVCEGVEVLVATDHDCQNDFSAPLARLSEALTFDLGGWIRLVVGDEVSPMSQHFTTFPLPVPAVGWAYWQIPWARYEGDRYVGAQEFPALWARARQLGAEIINVAHPLGSKGYFSNLGFEPPVSFPRLASLPPEKFTTAFDTVELLNSRDVGRMLDQTLAVWCSFNNQGVFKTAVGTSDAHDRGDVAGFGRTLITSPTDEPATVDLLTLWANLRARRAAVFGGIFLRMKIDQAGPGDLVSKTAPFEVWLHAEAADWVPVDQLELLANGVVVATIPLAAAGVVDPDHPAVRYAGVVSVSPSVDTWYAAVAFGKPADSLSPVCPGCRPVGMTNAIQVDLDGNGQFDPLEK